MSMDQELSWLVEVSRYIKCDDDHAFAIFMKKRLPKEVSMSDGNGNTLFITQVFKCICQHRAIKCASVLLEGKVGLCIDPNARLLSGLSPLHLAAQSLHRGITNLLLLVGADPNLCVNGNQYEVPLTFALDALCNIPAVTDWNSKKSIFKLFYILCLKELYEPMELIKFLALRTDQVQAIGLQCVEAGNLVKLGALLMVAWPKLVAPFLDQGLKSCPIGTYILKELHILSHQEADLASADSSGLVPLRERKETLISAWKILRVLELCRYRIELSRPYLKTLSNFRVPFYLSKHLSTTCDIPPLLAEDVFFDDVNCLMPELPPKEKARLYKILDKQISLGSTLGSVSKKHCSVGASHARPFHTARDFSCSFLKCEPLRKEAVKSTLPLPSTNLWAVVASVARRIPK